MKLQTTVEGVKANDFVTLITTITNPEGKVVAQDSTVRKVIPELETLDQNFLVENPQLWSPETPYLYNANTKVFFEGKEVDSYNTRFGIRSVEYVAEKGFFLNGKVRKFQGVCNHHDLGPLGAAVNTAALRRQLTLLKEMGADACIESVCA